MTGVDMAQMAESLAKIAYILNSLGVPGLVALAFAGPASVLCVILAIDYHRSRKVQDVMEAMRSEMRAVLESYRGDTQQLVREFTAGIARTEKLYRDNVELMKQCSRMAEGYQDVIISNTRAVEQLVTYIKAVGAL